MGGLDWKVLMHILDLSETNITFFLDIGPIDTVNICIVHSIGCFLVLNTLMHSGYFDSSEENHK